MADVWAEEEMATADLGDRRLNQRLNEVLSQLGARPQAGIPAACGGHAETTAAYRLFDHERATFEALLAPHVDATRRRVAAQPRVILVQDTTEVDVTRPHTEVAGAGPLDGGARRGLLLHPLQAYTPDGTPLGTLGACLWTRAEPPTDAPRASREERRAQRKRTPVEDKESFRWIRMLRQAQAEARRAPDTRMVCVSDSESDVFELLVEAQAEPRLLDWVVRAAQDRALDPGTAEGRLRDALAQAPVLFTQEVTLRAREAKVTCKAKGEGRARTRAARKAHVEVRAARVTLRPPAREDRRLPAVEVNAVWVYEPSPPPGEEPVEWLLLTSLPVDTLAQVREVLACYCVRWMIEVFFRTLKTGCRVEERRFEAADRLTACLALYLVVAWRTLYVCRLGRSCPELGCEAVFEPAEWKAVYRVVRRAPLPPAPPSLGEMVRWVAQLGGYLPRRHSQPGPQTVWLGLQRMHDLVLAWKAFGPEAQDV